ncbi:hypothetical protein NX059_003761 [Plenodomus lindquistii]|nr:hypothetical protein NX059_003761 [Plenodomus lindquistii]
MSSGESTYTIEIMDSVVREPQSSPFLDLFPEIRNAIYSFATDHTESWTWAPHLPTYPEEFEEEGGNVALVDNIDWKLAPTVERIVTFESDDTEQSEAANVTCLHTLAGYIALSDHLHRLFRTYTS